MVGKAMVEPINQEMRRHQETVDDWDLCEAMNTLYGLYDDINERFYDEELPTCVLSFQTRRKDNRGHYVLQRNSSGLRCDININSKHLPDPLERVAHTLAHEMGHCYFDIYGEPGKGRYHKKPFREKMDEIGTPCTEWGKGLGNEEPFVSFLRERGIGPTTRLDLPVPEEEDGGDEEGDDGHEGGGQTDPSSSPLDRWTCPCGTVVYATRDINVQCLECGEDLALKAKKDEPEKS